MNASVTTVRSPAIRWGSPLSVLLFSLAYLGGAELGHWLSAERGQFATFWPNSGLYLAVLLCTPSRRWWLVVAAGAGSNLASNLLHGQPPYAILGFTLANTLEAVLGAAVLRRWLGPSIRLQDLRSVFTVFGVAALLSVPAAGVLGAATAAAVFGAPFLSAWQLWWAADAIGVVLAAPLVLRLSDARGRLSPGRALEAGLLLAGLLLAAHYVFQLAPSSPPAVLMLFLLWAALRFGVLGAAAASLVLAVAAIGHTLAGHGLFTVASSPPDRAVYVQAFGTVAGLVSCAFAVVLEGARRAEAELEAKVQQRSAALLAESELLHVTLMSIGDAVISTDAAGLVHRMNAAAEALTGWTNREAAGQPLGAVFRILDEQTREPVRSPVDRVLALGHVVRLANHTVLVARDGTKRPIDHSAAPIRDSTGAGSGVVLVFQDATRRRRDELLLAGQKRVLEMAATNAPLAAVLSALCLVIEEQDPGLLCSVLLLGEGGRRIRFGAGPSLPQPYVQALNGLPIDPPYVGPCGMALDTGQTVVVENIATDHRWADVWRQLASEGGLRACRSMAIFDRDGRAVIGTLAMYRREPGDPLPSNANLVVVARHLTGIVIENARLVEDLRQADRKKDEFLSILAHELRNPLAPLRNGLQLMKLAKLDAPTVENTRAMMERQLGQMVRLIDDLMDLTRISGGKIALKKTRVPLARVLMNAVETSRSLIEAGGHELTLDMPEDPIFLEADEVRLSQVFANLLNNAAKYTERGGHIRLTVEQRGPDVAVAVEDDGVGIPAPMLARIFDMFTQVDSSLEKAQGGLGIGLSLVRRLVEKHGGTVVAESEGQGMGSRFVVRLPAIPAPEAEGRGAGDEPKPHGGRRVLVVDDNQDAADSLALMLQVMGYGTRAVYDGFAAVGAAEVFRPDVILMDIGMPGLNGYDACRRIREQPWGIHILMVACTGWGQDEDRRKSKEAGFDLHLVKPVDLGALEKVLAEPLP